MPDVAISCGKVSYSSGVEKCCYFSPGDSHGPKGPRNDIIVDALLRYRNSSINLNFHS